MTQKPPTPLNWLDPRLGALVLLACGGAATKD
jgi:hypothetical protein